VERCTGSNSPPAEQLPALCMLLLLLQQLLPLHHGVHAAAGQQ
jgi:hypothetical protein